MPFIQQNHALIDKISFTPLTNLVLVLSRMAKNQEFCEKYLEDEEFRKEVDNVLLPLVHSQLSKVQELEVGDISTTLVPQI